MTATVIEEPITPPMDPNVPDTPAWWLSRLWTQLYYQRERCQRLQDRFEGNPPLPFVANLQREAVRWFVEKSRSNFERMIVSAVISRLQVIGIRTAVDSDEGGDADAYSAWVQARGHLAILDALKMASAMSMSYVIAGRDSDGFPLLTAEDPRLVTAICDPADPYKVLAALKVFHDDSADEDVAYLYLPGQRLVARRPRKTATANMTKAFYAASWTWDAKVAAMPNLGEFQARDFVVETDGQTVTGKLPPRTCVIPFYNEDGMAEFEPVIHILDRINQQILQRMTIATVQAFKQRAFKGLPTNDPKTGEKIDWDAIFVADPGAIWNIPASVEIWESQEVNLQPILLAIRDDVKDLAVTSGTPLYTVTPEAAQGSAEGASLQREQIKFKVRTRQTRYDPSIALTAELLFRIIGDDRRAQPRTVTTLWAPPDQPSMTERANAIAQTKGVIPIYQQLTEIWGMPPDQADRAMTELKADQQSQMQMMAAQAQLNQPPPGQQQGQPSDNSGS